MKLLFLLLSTAALAVVPSDARKSSHPYESSRSDSSSLSDNESKSKSSNQLELVPIGGEQSRAKKSTGVPSYAVPMEPLARYSQPDPLYSANKTVGGAAAKTQIVRVKKENTQFGRYLQPRSYSPKVDYLSQYDDKDVVQRFGYGDHDAYYDDHYQHDPEPIIEIIIKESNQSLPAPPPPPPPKKKKKEPVQVFYVKYKKEPHYGQDKIVYEPPVPAITPPTNNGGHHEDDDDEEEYHNHHHHHEESATLPPRPSTTLKAIIRPDSETYHGSGIHITFGKPRPEELGESNHHDEHQSIGDYEEQSAPQPSVILPPKPKVSNPLTQNQPVDLLAKGKRNPAPFQSPTQPPQQSLHSNQQVFSTPKTFYQPTAVPPFPYTPRFSAQPHPFTVAKQNYPAPSLPPFTQRGNLSLISFGYSTLPKIQPTFYPTSPPQQLVSQSTVHSQQIFSINQPHLKSSFHINTRSTPQPYHTISNRVTQNGFSKIQTQPTSSPAPSFPFAKPFSYTGHPFPKPPQPPIFANSPQPPTFSNPPPPPRFSNPPQPSTFSNPPHPPRFSHPPQPPTFSNPPQPPTFSNPPQPPTFSNPPQPPTFSNPPNTFPPANNFFPQTTFSQPSRVTTQRIPHAPVKPSALPPQQHFSRAPLQPTQHQIQHHNFQQLQLQHQQQQLEKLQQFQRQQQAEQLNLLQRQQQLELQRQQQAEQFRQQEHFHSQQKVEQLNQQQQIEQLNKLHRHQQHQHIQQQQQQQHFQQQHHFQEQSFTQQKSEGNYVPEAPEIIKSISPDLPFTGHRFEPKPETQTTRPRYSQSTTYKTHSYPATDKQIAQTYTTAKRVTPPQTTTTTPNYKSSTTPPPIEYITDDPKTAEEKRKKQEEKKKQNVAALPQEVPEDLREQLLSSGILGNADIQILDYDKIGDIPIDKLPPEALANFQAVAGSEPVPSVVHPKDSEEDEEAEGSEQLGVAVPPPEGMEMKVVRYNPDTDEGAKLADKYMKDGATQLEPVVLNDSSYNRYLPLKVSGAQFPVPDVEELRGKNVTSVVVLAPVDYEFLQREEPREGRSSFPHPVLEVQGVHFVAGDVLKTLVKRPTAENFKIWLERESKTAVDKQSVILLVVDHDNSTAEPKEIFMYDIGTRKVSKLSGELSAQFVEVAESNSENDDLDEISDGKDTSFTVKDASEAPRALIRTRRTVPTHPILNPERIAWLEMEKR